ncbi:MAG: chorismate mutase [Bacilli bacterium]|nr:chorismate mutase [Bacilli bacterium]
MDLKELRQQIDEIDTKIIALYEQRMEIVKQVSIYKIANNIPVLDASREQLMLDKNLNKINIEEFKKYYQAVLEGFLKASKAMQQDLLDQHK